MDESTLTEVTGIEQRDMSREQYKYCCARALYETRESKYKQRAKAEVKPLDHDNKADVDRFIREDGQIYAECRVAESFEIMTKAEDLLITWADKQMRKSLGRQRYRQIEECFRSGPKSGMKQKLVNICMQFRVELPRR